MATLTPKERKTLNDISRARSLKVKLGDLFLTSGGGAKVFMGTPHNAKFASGYWYKIKCNEVGVE